MQEPGCLSRGMPKEPLDEAMLLQHELFVCTTHAVRANSPAVTGFSNIHAPLVKVAKVRGYVLRRGRKRVALEVHFYQGAS